MAPTTVLAEQHFLGISALLDGFEVPEADDTARTCSLVRASTARCRLALLTNRTTAAERRKLVERLERGDVDLLVGTHALIEEGVRFKSLGAVVIDEQHRFGVGSSARRFARRAPAGPPPTSWS